MVMRRSGQLRPLENGRTDPVPCLSDGGVGEPHG